MKPAHIRLALLTCIKAQRPAFVWGSPGLGKSDTVRQVAAEIARNPADYLPPAIAATARATGYHVCDFRAVLRDAVDLHGLPADGGDGWTKWLKPGDLPRDGAGIFLMDELPNAPQLVQAGCLQLTLDRQIGEYRLPDGYSIIAAGNRETDRAGTTRLISSLSARFTHLDFDHDLHDWTRWALAAGVETLLIAFLHQRPGLLLEFDSKRRANPNPRSWEFVDRLEKAAPPAEILHALISGTVGEGAASEYAGFKRIHASLASPAAILANPAGVAIPDDLSVRYATCVALAGQATAANMAAIVTYADRLPDAFGVLLVMAAARHCPAATQTRAYIAYTTNHQEVLV